MVLIGAETFSRLLDWEDRGTCVLFGDGAGAIVMRAANGADKTSAAEGGQGGEGGGGEGGQGGEGGGARAGEVGQGGEEGRGEGRPSRQAGM